MKKIIKVFILLCVTGFAVPKTYAQVSLSITVGTPPPPLRVYEQPECPVDGYIWQPGYWAYDNDEGGYYWVPGVWVAPPNPGLYWTPAYWGYNGGVYGFHSGYWGPHVGFYGGINYGYGYSGRGYGGGRWDGNRFRYNTAVVRVNRTVVHNTYIDRTVVRTNNNRTSFNGRGGVTARPRAQERAAMKERHIQPTSNQISHQEAAHKSRNSFVKADRGRPAANRPNAAARPNNRTAGAKPTATRPVHNERPEQKRAAQQPRVQPQHNPQQRAAQPRRDPAQRQRSQQQRAPQQQRAQQQQRAPQQREPQQRAPQPQRAPQQRAPQQHAQQPHSAPRPEHHR